MTHSAPHRDPEPVSALDAARAALAAHVGGPAVAIAATVPPEPVRRILIFESGQVRGTLGDPSADAAALQAARNALDSGTPATVSIPLAGRTIAVYAEAHRGPPELLVVGAGHIAVPLAELGVMLGYRVTVLDDREEFATPERFPDAARVLQMDFSDPFRDVTIGPRAHILLVTRAHKYDFDCLERLVRDNVSPAYIGMIGSRRRVRAAFLALLQAGVPRQRLAAVRAPVGLDIGAETPEEIAVSIAAELVALRRKGRIEAAAPLSDQERVLDRFLPE